MTRAAKLVLLWLLIGASPLDAQSWAHLTVGATISGIQRAAREVGTVRHSDGFLGGVDITARAGIVSLSGSYREGSLSDDAGGGKFSYVEGSAALMVRIAPWLEVGSGVRVHRVDEVDPERWMAWGAGGRVELPILGPMVRGHATYFQGLGGEVNFPESDVSARGGEVGVTFTPIGRPFLIDLSTRVEENSSSGRTRTLQQLALSVGWNVW
jgi:hypothetical protein